MRVAAILRKAVADSVTSTRPRGRPRKIVPEIEPITPREAPQKVAVEEAKQVQEPKKRGRPRKLVVEESKKLVEPKKRGRPRKIDIEKLQDGLPKSVVEETKNATAKISLTTETKPRKVQQPIDATEVATVVKPVKIKKLSKELQREGTQAEDAQSKEPRKLQSKITGLVDPVDSTAESLIKPKRLGRPLSISKSSQLRMKQSDKDTSSAGRKPGWSSNNLSYGEQSKWVPLTVKDVQDKSPILANILKSKLAEGKSSAKSGIISELQCAQIFERFNLEEYQGCEIYDFNPGYGVYSAALNAAINPSKHLLVEPEQHYHNFLKHTCTHESFHIVGKDAYDFATFDEIISQGLIKPKFVPREDGVNKSFLVTGMLHKQVKGDRFMAQIIDAMGKQDWFYKYGRVKTLLWADSVMIARYIPRSFGRRNRPAVLIEAFTDTRELAHPEQVFTRSDKTFFGRVERFNEPNHQVHHADVYSGVALVDNLTYFSMPKEPPAVVMDLKSYWPQLPWAMATLLDITPKLPISYLRGDEKDTEPWKFFNYIVSSCFMSRHSTVREALAKLGGGVEQLLDTDEALLETPEIANKPVVFLTIEDMVKLARGYEFWPFRREDPFLGQELRLKPGTVTDPFT